VQAEDGIRDFHVTGVQTCALPILMGLVYHLLPQLGWRAPRGRAAVLQPWLYGIGQLLHIAGLVWSGGYGVQRKVAGSEQVLRSAGETAGLGVRGAGGVRAMGGGVRCVAVVLRARGC